MNAHNCPKCGAPVGCDGKHYADVMTVFSNKDESTAEIKRLQAERDAMQRRAEAAESDMESLQAELEQARAELRWYDRNTYNALVKLTGGYGPAQPPNHNTPESIPSGGHWLEELLKVINNQDSSIKQRYEQQLEQARQQFMRCEIHLLATSESDNKRLADDAKELLAEIQALSPQEPSTEPTVMCSQHNIFFCEECGQEPSE